MLNGLALCTGVGGLEIGVGRALDGQYRCVCYVEHDAFAASVLVARMEDASLDPAPIWNDVKTFDGKPWRGAVDIITAGYPCQPFSISGKRQGTADQRHLWPHIAKIIEAVKPRICFFENVPGHISIGLRAVLTDLVGIGYRVATKAGRPLTGVFSSAEVGAPHLRERLFILAVADADKLGPEKRGEGRWPHQLDTSKQTVADMGYKKRHSTGRGSKDKVSGGADGVDGLGQWPPGRDAAKEWRKVIAQRPDLKPSLRGVVDGFPDWVDRIHALGNAVNPATAELAFRTLMERVE